jgi:5-hydroxyisourate hydrolase
VNARSPTVIVSLPIDGRIRATVVGVADPVAAAPTISTHVLDTESGQPAAGVHVSLYKLGEDERPIRLTQALTDGDGRVRDLLDRPMSPGTYRLEFNLASPRGPATGDDDRRFFRRMSVDLRIDDVSRSYHVPLLLAPFSMTTYRGS